MKTRLSLIILSAVLVCACSPDSAIEYDFSNYKIDKVVCGAGSNYLVADNISELDLDVKIYTKTGTYTDIYGELRDMYTEIPKERWRKHDIKFYVNGSQATPPIKTSNASPATLQCYAEVDGIRSSQSPAKLLALYPPYHDKTKSDATAPEYTPDPDPLYFEVTVRAAYTPPARRIPVVFHIIDHNENAKRGQELESSAIYAMIDLLNKVYGRKNSNASCGANPNLEFVPAVRDTSGIKLAEPGINRVYVNDTETSNYTSNYTAWIWNLNKTDEGLDMNNDRYKALLASGTLPVRKPRAFWNPDKYLNIWVLYNLSELTFTNLLSTYIPRLYPEGVYKYEDFPLPAVWVNVIRAMTPEQLAMWKKNPYDLRLPPETFGDKIKDLGQAGIFIPKANVANNDISITQNVGAFLGLIPNAPLSKSTDYQANPSSSIAKVWLDDYCDDTPAYNRWFDSAEYGGIVPVTRDGTSRTKYTVTAPYLVYNSFNIMESNSAASYISQDQVKRMQWVLENAPGRQMWKDTWAID